MRFWLVAVLFLIMTSGHGPKAQVPTGAIPVLTCQVPDVEAAQREDAVSGLVPRFAIPTGIGFNSQEEGVWTEEPSGGYVWKLEIVAPGARSLLLISGDMPLLPGGWVEVRDTAGRVLERISHSDRDRVSVPARTLGPFKGERLLLLYRSPKDPVPFRVDEIYYGVSDDHDPASVEEVNTLGFGTSLPCQVNIGCLSDPVIQRAGNSVVRILLVFQEGASWCSGSLINNVRMDKKPYILSAFHCQYGYTPLTQFWGYFFRYQGEGCQNPPSEPILHKATGSEVRAKWQDSDFLLLEITDELPSTVDMTFAGWNRADKYLPLRSMLIHHPSADIKKVSVDSQAVWIWITPVNWTNGIVTPPNHHYRGFMDLGSSEPGSSGGPLFDMQGRIIGQLHGGGSTCAKEGAWYGRFFNSWTGGGTPQTRLKDWLDPDNTGVTQLGDTTETGISTFALSGKVTTVVGHPVPGVEVSISGGMSATTFTKADGTYSFSDLPAGYSYTVTASRGGDYILGVSIADIVLLNKYLVGSSLLPTAYSYVAADVNLSNSVSVADMLVLKRLLLDIIKDLQGAPSWVFVRNTGFPFLPSWELPLLNQNATGFDFVGIKMGDINHSATP